MHFWQLINPLNNSDNIDGKILFAFIKLIYDPYFDGTAESF